MKIIHYCLFETIKTLNMRSKILSVICKKDITDIVLAWKTDDKEGISEKIEDVNCPLCIRHFNLKLLS